EYAQDRRQFRVKFKATSGAISLTTRFLPSSSFSQLCRNGPGAAIHSSPRERQFNLAWAEIAISAAQKSPPGVHLLAARPRSNEMSRESKEEFSRRQREREKERDGDRDADETRVDGMSRGCFAYPWRWIC
ncbi:hypothetical protein ALC56_01338, partial [Trachymyrmex septentrionalis]